MNVIACFHHGSKPSICYRPKKNYRCFQFGRSKLQASCRNIGSKCKYSSLNNSRLRYRRKRRSNAERCTMARIKSHLLRFHFHFLHFQYQCLLDHIHQVKWHNHKRSCTEHLPSHRSIYWSDTWKFCIYRSLGHPNPLVLVARVL